LHEEPRLKAQFTLKFKSRSHHIFVGVREFLRSKEKSLGEAVILRTLYAYRKLISDEMVLDFFVGLEGNAPEELPRTPTYGYVPRLPKFKVKPIILLKRW